MKKPTLYFLFLVLFIALSSFAYAQECADDYYAPIDISKLYGLKLVPPNTNVGVEYHVGGRQCLPVVDQKVELLYVEKSSDFAQTLLYYADRIEHLFSIAGPEQFEEIESCQEDRTQAFVISVPEGQYDVFYGSPETPSEEGEYILVAGAYNNCGEDYVNFAVVDEIVVSSTAQASEEICDSHFDEDFDGKIGARDIDCGGEVGEKPYIPYSKLKTYILEPNLKWYEAALTEFRPLEAAYFAEESSVCKKTSECVSGSMCIRASDSSRATKEKELVFEILNEYSNDAQNMVVQIIDFINILYTLEDVEDYGLCVEDKEELDILQWIKDNQLIVGIAAVVLLLLLFMPGGKKR